MAKNQLKNIIETERFRLVPLNRYQAFWLTYPWTKDSAFMSDYIGSGQKVSPLRWFRKMTRPNNKTKFSHAIIPHGETKAIGLHNIIIRPYKTCILAVGIPERSWWGKGVVHEVRSRIIDHVFEHSDVDKFLAVVNARNFPSIFNYRKHGFTHVGTLHRVKQDPVTGDIHDMLHFELFREEWMARKALNDE